MRSDLLSRGPSVTTRAGEAVAVPASTRLLLIASGIVVSTVTLSQRRFVAFFAGEGDLLLSPDDGVTLEALRPSRLIVIDDAKREALLADPDAAGELVDRLAAALLEREESLAHLAEVVHRERVLAKLLQLARKFGRVAPDGIRLDLPLTHQLLADAVGAARETVTVALRDLRQKGIVERKGRTYILKLPPRELGY
jgi:CRP-like cAMP-binding protein